MHHNADYKIIILNRMTYKTNQLSYSPNMRFDAAPLYNFALRSVTTSDGHKNIENMAEILTEKNAVNLLSKFCSYM